MFVSLKKRIFASNIGRRNHDTILPRGENNEQKHPTTMKKTSKRLFAALAIAGAMAMPQGAQAQTGANDSVYSKASDGYLNIRQRPSAKSKVVGQLFTGSTGARLLGKEGNWLRVVKEGKTGYVHCAYAAFRRAPIPGDRQRRVYMVVLSSFDTYEKAKAGAEAFMQDWLNHVIYKGYANGKAVYRLCTACYYSREKAQACVAELDKALSPGIAWIWESKGMPECVYCPEGLNDETFDTPLVPQ